jgi:acylphosphatase
MRRVRVLVSGRVQAVFFRATCAREARARGTAGAVRNLPDGRVEAIFEGTDDAVQEMVRWCAHGPPGARVDLVEVTEEEPKGEPGFRIEG